MLVASASITTASPARPMPSARASSAPTFPAGIGRFAVRFITASMSASHHMFNAPEAPAPSAMNRMAAKASIGCSAPGAATRPTSAVNTTSDITRGFRSAK